VRGWAATGADRAAARLRRSRTCVRWLAPCCLSIASSTALGQGQAGSPVPQWGAQVMPPGLTIQGSPRSPDRQAPLPAVTAPDAQQQRIPNTTVITKTPERVPTVQEKNRAGVVQLQALLTDSGTRIDQGIVWRIYEGDPGQDGKHKLLGTQKDAAPTLRIQPGEYMINVAFGRANLTRKVSVKPGENHAERFVLNAGGLRVTAVTASGEPISDRNAHFDIYSDERDQFGNRTKVMSEAKLGLIIRLNAGIYNIVSVHGDANAITRADVTVEAGKLTEATLRHSAARVTFKLVPKLGGEAIADVKWQIATPEGLLIKESLGALPTHMLQPGTYVAVAHFGGQVYAAKFTLQPGETRQIEVVVQ
jgi:hypothetical protein